MICTYLWVCMWCKSMNVYRRVYCMSIVVCVLVGMAAGLVANIDRQAWEDRQIPVSRDVDSSWSTGQWAPREHAHSYYRKPWLWRSRDRDGIKHETRDGAVPRQYSLIHVGVHVGETRSTLILRMNQERGNEVGSTDIKHTGTAHKQTFIENHL